MQEIALKGFFFLLYKNENTMHRSILLLLFIHITICVCKTYLFISIPFIGHITPLIRQAIELDARHRNETEIYIISCSNIRNYVERHCVNTTIQFLDIGSCQNDSKVSEDLQSLANQSSFLSSVSILFQAIIELYHPQMYQRMLNTIDNELFQNDPTTIAIVDHVTYAGADIAHHFGIPCIVNFAGLLPYLGWHVLPPFDSNPTILLHSPQSIHSMGTNLFFRTILPTTRYLSLLYVYFRYDRQMNHSVHIWSRYQSHLILVNNAFGLEYPQDIPANVHFTGPMLPLQHSLDWYVKQLSEEDQRWIHSDSRPIIYINFGTCISLTDEQVQKIFLALQSFDQYRIVWKLDRHDLPSIENVRITPWISSSLGYLAHSSVHLFLSHCGINSVYESIWLGTSILCIPIFADQQDMAQRVADAGVGRWLNKFTFTSEQLQQTIEIMFRNEERRTRERNIRRIQAWMRFHGGIERAVDLIETVTEHGIDGLVSLHRSYPWYAYYNVDVYAIWLLLLILLRKCIVHCWHDKRNFAKHASKTKTL